MRWICKNDIERCLNAKWRKRAAAKTATILRKATIEDKRKELKKVSSTKIWRDFYDLLPDPLKKKCWYCEAEEIRSDMPIDHFRPKSKVEGVNTHDGYWWLAFSWENYRCACTYCNSSRRFEDTSGGKQCKFPIVDDTKRAFKYTDRWQDEEPNFLDPFNPDDFKFIWFDNDGIPVPRPAASEKQITKVNNSIEIFHLNEKRLVKRRNDIRINVVNKIKALKDAKENNDNNRCREIKEELRKIVRDTEMLSRAAVVYLRAYRNIDEVKEILNLD